MALETQLVNADYLSICMAHNSYSFENNGEKNWEKNNQNRKWRAIALTNHCEILKNIKIGWTFLEVDSWKKLFFSKKLSIFIFFIWTVCFCQSNHIYLYFVLLIVDLLSLLPKKKNITSRKMEKNRIFRKIIRYQRYSFWVIAAFSLLFTKMTLQLYNESLLTTYKCDEKIGTVSFCFITSY